MTEQTQGNKPNESEPVQGEDAQPSAHADHDISSQEREMAAGTAAENVQPSASADNPSVNQSTQETDSSPEEKVEQGLAQAGDGLAELDQDAQDKRRDAEQAESLFQQVQSKASSVVGSLMPGRRNSDNRGNGDDDGNVAVAQSNGGGRFGMMPRFIFGTIAIGAVVIILLSTVFQGGTAQNLSLGIDHEASSANVQGMSVIETRTDRLAVSDLNALLEDETDEEGVAMDQSNDFASLYRIIEDNNSPLPRFGFAEDEITEDQHVREYELGTAVIDGSSALDKELVPFGLHWSALGQKSSGIWSETITVRLQVIVEEPFGYGEIEEADDSADLDAAAAELCGTDDQSDDAVADASDVEDAEGSEDDVEELEAEETELQLALYPVEFTIGVVEDEDGRPTYGLLGSTGDIRVSNIEFVRDEDGNIMSVDVDGELMPQMLLTFDRAEDLGKSAEIEIECVEEEEETTVTGGTTTTTETTSATDDTDAEDTEEVQVAIPVKGLVVKFPCDRSSVLVTHAYYTENNESEHHDLAVAYANDPQSFYDALVDNGFCAEDREKELGTVICLKADRDTPDCPADDEVGLPVEGKGNPHESETASIKPLEVERAKSTVPNSDKPSGSNNTHIDQIDADGDGEADHARVRIRGVANDSGAGAQEPAEHDQERIERMNSTTSVADAFNTLGDDEADDN